MASPDTAAPTADAPEAPATPTAAAAAVSTIVTFEPYCLGCGKPQSTLAQRIFKCDGCQTATYCSETCQVRNFWAHRKLCNFWAAHTARSVCCVADRQRAPGLSPEHKFWHKFAARGRRAKELAAKVGIVIKRHHDKECGGIG